MNIETTRLPRVLPAILAAALASAAGCANGQPEALRRRFPPPVQPISDPLVANRWYYGWEKQEDLLCEGQPTNIQIIRTPRGRDWRYPEGPDGYPVRVSLLDETDEYVRARGGIKAFLVHEPVRATSRALCAWQVSVEDAERRIRGVPVGYILQLDWGPTPPPARGSYMLVVRWESQDGLCRLTKATFFEEFIPDAAIETTTRPAR